MNTNLFDTNAVDHLKETTIDGGTVFEGSFIKVQRDRVRLPDGSEALREFVRHPGAVAILALSDDGRLIVERQYRHPLERAFIEIPAGKIDPGEMPLETARRELIEETGYRASEWVHLGTAHACIGYADERIEYYIAQGLTAGCAELDHGELLDVFDVPLELAIDWAHTGNITDSKTIVGLFWLERYLRQQKAQP